MAYKTKIFWWYLESSCMTDFSDNEYFDDRNHLHVSTSKIWDLYVTLWPKWISRIHILSSLLSTHPSTNTSSHTITTTKSWCLSSIQQYHLFPSFPTFQSFTQKASQWGDHVYLFVCRLRCTCIFTYAWVRLYAGACARACVGVFLCNYIGQNEDLLISFFLLANYFLFPLLLFCPPLLFWLFLHLSLLAEI